MGVGLPSDDNFQPITSFVSIAMQSHSQRQQIFLNSALNMEDETTDEQFVESAHAGKKTRICCKKWTRTSSNNRFGILNQYRFQVFFYF